MTRSAVGFLTEEEMAIEKEIEAEDRAAKGEAGETPPEGDPPADPPKDETPPGDPPETTPTEEPPKDETPPKEETPPVEEASEPVAQQPVAHVPVMVAEKPENFEERMTGFEKSKEELDVKFEQGEVTPPEYRKQLDAINREQATLQRQQDEFEFAERQNLANARQVWRATVEGYATQHKELTTNAGRAAWNAELQGLIRDKDANGKPMHWFLTEAHKRMRETLGIGTAPAASSKPSGQPPKRTTPAAPTTLQGMPSAAPVDTGKDEFAYIDGLSGVEQEAALERLERKDPHAYLRYLEGR